MTGSFTLHAQVEGDEEEFLRSLPGRVDVMAADLVDDLVDYAHGRIQENAPGGIYFLVDKEGSSAVDPGVFEGVAGVTPAHEGGEQGKRFVQTGSDPRDYPFFVEVGTGIYGEFGSPITVPTGFMQIDFADGRVRTRSIKGQPAQQYVERSYEETLAYAPIRIASSRLPSGGT